MTSITSDKNINFVIGPTQYSYAKQDIDYIPPPLKLTRSAATGYSCLNRYCKLFSANPAIEHAIKENRFIEDTYSYYTPHNNTVWSTMCYYCEKCDSCNSKL